MARRMRYLTACLGLLLAACSSPAGPSPSTGKAAPAQPSPSAAPPTEATQTASPSPTIEPSPSPTISPLGTPFGAAIFSDPDSCTNPELMESLDVAGGTRLGYRVAYPASWYSNAAMPNIAACWLFAPTDFAVVYGTEISSDVAVIIRAFEVPEGFVYEYNPPRNARIVSDSTTTVAGRPARYQELEITERDIAHHVGDRIARYVVQVTELKYLTAETYRGPDYSTAKTVLDQTVLTLEFLAP